jgi:serine/threonine-protein kinase
VTLQAAEGPIEGQVFEFDEHDIFIFGRSPDCHARLPEGDPTASRHHFIIEVSPPDACVRDLGSLNGTYVNDNKYGGREASESPGEAAKREYPEVDLKDGDVIRVGKTVFTVQVALPAQCCDCGRDIADGERRACEWVGGTYICPACRAKAAEPKKAPPKAKGAGKPRKQPPKPKPKPLRCKQCGKDVSAEVGRGRRGDYVCKACQAKAEQDPAELLLRLILEHVEAKPAGVREIPGYEIGRMLGKGGMGAVYLAKRKKDRADVALKVMLSKVAVDERARKMFEREIDVIGGFRHANIVELYDHGSAGTAFYFVMEFCPGGSLEGLMARRGGKLSLFEAGWITVQALEGLNYLHKKGFVHRDLKPANILLTEIEGATGDFWWTAKVTDFGLAKNFERAGMSRMTKTGMAAGTFPFMAREQLVNFKYVKPVSDVWSMAATLYNALTGQLPRDFRRGQDPFEAILRQPVVPIRKRDSSIPKKVAEVIDRSLEDNLKGRYQTAAEFKRALKKVL